MAQIYASKTNEIQKYETEHENEVRHLAGECMVLLENDGVLPFSDKIKKIALYALVNTKSMMKSQLYLAHIFFIIVALLIG